MSNEAAGADLVTTELEAVIYEREGPLARIILNQPETANAQSSAMVHDVEACLQDAEHDYDVRVVILKANGRGFCSGHLIGREGTAYEEFREAQEKVGSAWQPQFDLFVWPVLHLWEFPKPVIAQVHGYAIGGGTYFALLPDITIASDDAYFQMPLVQGLGLPGGETMIEPWVFMNWKRAAEYLYTAQTLSAQEAFQMGLVNHVVPRADLESTVEAMAQQIAKAPMTTLRATKTLIKRAWEQMGLRLHLQMSNDLLSLTAAHSDVRAIHEGMGPVRIPPRQWAAKRLGGEVRSGGEETDSAG
jgi:enoyl-CoA hydratase/carnithine racemase